ncbi:MAG: hydrogenase maturation nickel metallochaperone HypA [Candidatus Eremiobacteraeota bacterium]|nr:hydrogenase maturation nickel metallochaperone HypA [Candidatus Eremiobacteraeota bacterium]
MSLVESVCERAEAEGADKINMVHVRIGAMAGVVRDSLLFAWDLATEGTPAAGAKLEIEHVSLEVFCTACDATRVIEGPAILECPRCGALTPTIVRGRELQLISMEVSDAVTTG